MEAIDLSLGIKRSLHVRTARRGSMSVEKLANQSRRDAVLMRLQTALIQGPASVGKTCRDPRRCQCVFLFDSLGIEKEHAPTEWLAGEEGAVTLQFVPLKATPVGNS